jgi:BASS family bile acid:Na+ symporter
MVVKNVVMGSVILLMLGVGLRTAFADIALVARQPRPLLLGLLANFLVVPLFIYLGLCFLPLPPDVKIGIMLMAAAPVAPMAPPFVGMAKGDLPYSVGLMGAAGLLSIPLTPLILALSLPTSEGGVSVDALQIVKTLLMVQLIPICAGMTLRHARPAWADRLLKNVPKLGQIGLLIGVGLLLAKQAGQILAIGLFPYVVLAVLVVASLLIGHWTLVGGAAEKQRALAVSTAIRNIPLAFLIANASFPGTVVAPVTLVFSVLTMVGSVVYGKLMSGPAIRSSVPPPS